MDEKGYLYRHYDVDSVLLYVGATANPFARTSQHKSRSQWFDRVAKITIEHCELEELERAEQDAISSEKPLFNYTNKTREVRINYRKASEALLEQRSYGRKPKHLYSIGELETIVSHFNDWRLISNEEKVAAVKADIPRFAGDTIYLLKRQGILNDI